MPECTQPDGTAAPRLPDVLRKTLRVRHYSLRTEQQYVNWVRRFLRFHPHRHPREMGAAEVSTVCPQNQTRQIAVFYGRLPGYTRKARRARSFIR